MCPQLERCPRTPRKRSSGSDISVSEVKFVADFNCLANGDFLIADFQRQHLLARLVELDDRAGDDLHDLADRLASGGERYDDRHFDFQQAASVSRQPQSFVERTVRQPLWQTTGEGVGSYGPAVGG